MKVYYYIFLTALVIFVIVVSMIFSGEPERKADDVFYDRSLYNTMRLAKVPVDEIKCLLALPTSPEVDLEKMKISDTTQWFWVSPDLQIGIVFGLNGQCEIPGLKVYDLRGNKSK